MQERAADGIVWQVGDGGIARIIIDRPQQNNTLTHRAGQALVRAIDDIEAARPRVVLVTGRGKVFCAGGDIDEFKANAGELDRLIDQMLRVIHPAIQRLSELPVPVITAINGSVGGAGVGVALCGDFALAAASMKMRTGYAAIGLSPDLGSTWFTTRRIGSVRARQIFFTSEALDAQRCLDWGLVDAIYPDDQLAAAAEALCQRFAKAATGSLANIKRLCNGAPQRTLEEHLELEKSLLQARALSADGREGIAAFIERRPPNFVGE